MLFNKEFYYKINLSSKINIISFQIILILLFIIIALKNINVKFSVLKFFLAPYKHYLNDCRNLKKYKRISISKDIPHFSICLPVYNMEKFIEKALLSILNQSFQNFEIILVNDYSNDSTRNIITKMQLQDNRITLINHLKNLGVYTSRVDGILASRGKYILLMDPDDMLLNPKLLEELYNYNFKYNLDIIEFTVICYVEKNDNFKIIKRYYHNHNFTKKIIYQPELSDIFFYNSYTYNYSKVNCRVIWNKIIRRKVLLNSIYYIGKNYYNTFFITAEDTLINLISLHYAYNYSNINNPGYMYNIRLTSMTHGKSNIIKRKLFYYNHFLYLKKFYDYIIENNKNRFFLYYELIEINKLLIKLSKLSQKYKEEIMQFYKIISNDKNTPKKIKEVIKSFNFTSKTLKNRIFLS